MAKDKKENPWKKNLILTFVIIMGVVFLPTSVILFVGMVPTLVAYIADRTVGKEKTLSVGAMNLAGCMPFVLKLWMEGHSMKQAFVYVTQPKTIVIMYFAAAIGYLINWAMSGIWVSVTTQKGQLRLKDIEKEQAALIKRWGKEVNGKIPLDPDGFPYPEKKDEKEKGEEGDT